MSEDKIFAGQLILNQVLDIIPNAVLNEANRKHNANRYYKRFPFGYTWYLFYTEYSAIVTDCVKYVKGCWPVKVSLHVWD
jgi:hypothetical protein